MTNDSTWTLPECLRFDWVAAMTGERDTRLGKLTTITASDGSIVTISMIRWDPIRRQSMMRAAPAYGPFDLVPQHEIAVFKGPTTTTRTPFIIIHFADDETALRCWSSLPNLIDSLTLDGLLKFAKLNDEKEAWFAGIPGYSDADSQFNRGLTYLTGEGVPQNSAAAANSFRLAADQGLAGAQRAGRMFLLLWKRIFG